MARTRTDAQAATQEPDGADLPKFEFQEFKWTPDFPQGATVSMERYCKLINDVIDMADGAAMVMSLARACALDQDGYGEPYLNSYQIEKLERLAICSLDPLETRKFKPQIIHTNWQGANHEPYYL